MRTYVYGSIYTPCIYVYIYNIYIVCIYMYIRIYTRTEVAV